MSTTRTQSKPDILSVIDFNAPQQGWGSGLTRYIRKRRQQLGLTQERAAELAGLQLSQWCALESGWVPEGMDLLMGIAGALETSWADLSFLALIASPGQ